MITLVTGGRDYYDWYTVDLMLDLAGPSRIIHGTAMGADSLADRWATRRGVPQTGYPIRRGLGEDGFQRNQRMLDLEPDIELVIAFRGYSGTADMVRRARAKSLYVIEVK